MDNDPSRFYYAKVEEDEYGNLVCCGILDSPEEVNDESFIPVEGYYPELYSHKVYQAGEWVNNPNLPLVVAE